MAIAAGVIVLWPSTNASIPAGWTRETSLDGYYIQGATAGGNADLATVRGNLTHLHTSTPHTPLQNSHTHNFSAGSATPNTSNFSDLPSFTVARGTHTHTTAASASATATNNAITITIDPFTNGLAFIQAIFIKSDGTPLGVPNGAYTYFGSDVFPTSWARVNGDRYAVAPTAGADGGATGGSNTHTHTSPAHTHTQNAHTHAVTTSNANTQTVVTTVGGAATAASASHTHDLTFNNSTAVNNSVTTTFSTVSQEPVFKKVNLIQNNTGAVSLPGPIIAIWGSTNASIPANWSRVTQLDTYFPKNAAADGESLVTTGGSTTHTHTASDCQPTQTTHTHTSSASGPSSTDGNIADTGSTLGIALSLDTHTHTWTVTSVAATNQATAVSVSTTAAEDQYPQYKRVIFIQYTGAPLVTAGPPLLKTLGVGY